MPEPGAMSYMMSKDGYLNDEVGHWHPHLMFHIPKTDSASWGANLPASPVQLDTTRRAEQDVKYCLEESSGAHSGSNIRVERQ